MASVAGRPFLEILLSQLQRQGCTRVILSLGHLHEVIERHFCSGFRGMRVDYSVESTPLGTGGAIRLALTQTSQDDILVLNGDTFVQVNYAEMLNAHRMSGASLTIAVTLQQDISRYGAVILENRHIAGFREKGSSGAGWMNAGVYAISTKIPWPDNLPERFSFEHDFVAPAVIAIAPMAHLADGLFLDIGVPEDLDRAQELLAGIAV